MTNLSAFDLNLLKTLDAMLREGTTQAAGARIGLSQPAVSAALARLRAQLGDPLFVREGQRLTPTDFARELEAPLQEALALVETVLAGPEGFDPSTANFEFRMSGSDFFSDVLIPPLLAELRRDAPGVSVHMLDMVFSSNLNAVETFNIDLVFWPRFDRPKHLVAEDVMTSDFITCAPVGHPQLVRAGVSDGDPIPLDLYARSQYSHPDRRSVARPWPGAADRGKPANLCRRLQGRGRGWADRISATIASRAPPCRRPDHPASHAAADRNQLPDDVLAPPLDREAKPQMDAWADRKDPRPTFGCRARVNAQTGKLDQRFQGDKMNVSAVNRRNNPGVPLVTCSKHATSNRHGMRSHDLQDHIRRRSHRRLWNNGRR